MEGVTGGMLSSGKGIGYIAYTSSSSVKAGSGTSVEADGFVSAVWCIAQTHFGINTYSKN